MLVKYKYKYKRPALLGRRNTSADTEMDAAQDRHHLILVQFNFAAAQMNI